MALEIIFAISALAMLHTYIFYPALLLLFSGAKKRELVYDESELPAITIICAAYNEEKVIGEKVRSAFKTTYPANKITLAIGTDACTDSTVAILERLQTEFAGLKLHEFKQRTGKIGILNELVKKAGTEVLVMTDANVYFKQETLFELVKHFKDPAMGLVCGNIVKQALNKEAITSSELQYMNFENRLKLAESNLMDVVLGAEGGCYAARREIIKEIPPHFIADDFFITCLALRQKKKVIFEEKALASEDLAADSAGEFRRKARIAAGNFQNLFYFLDILGRFWSGAAFAFLSHKVLRWKTPFLFLASLLVAALLFKVHLFFRIVFFAELGLLLLPLINYLLVTAGIRIKLFIALSHFMLMNAALLTGFIRYCRGVKSSVWQPVKR